MGSSWDSAVCIVTTLRPGRPRNVGSIPGRSKQLLSSPNRSDRFWGPAFYSKGKGGDFTTGKSAWQKLDYPHPSSSKVKNKRSYTSTPPSDSMASTVIILPLLISNFRRVLNVLCFFLGNSLASEFYMLTFRNTLFHLHRRVGTKNTKFRCRGITQNKAYNLTFTMYYIWSRTFVLVVSIENFQMNVHSKCTITAMVQQA
jgi:hypothetical protein